LCSLLLQFSGFKPFTFEQTQHQPFLQNKQFTKLQPSIFSIRIEQEGQGFIFPSLISFKINGSISAIFCQQKINSTFFF
jgi:hypothetical protein